MLEDNKCKISDRDIYLEIDKFKKICAECNVDASDRLLEVYERHGLLYPLYRIIRPKDYLQKLFEQHHGVDGYKDVIEVPDEYRNLLKFEYGELSKWHHPISPEFNKALNEGHPLDQAYKKGESFIQRPSKETYRKWDKYKVVLETTINGKLLRNTDSLVRHFYSPWQIYILEEANCIHTRRVNVLIELNDKERYLNEPTQKLTLSKWEDYFKAVWEYRFKKNLLFTKALESSRGNILEGDDLKQFHRDCEVLFSEICARYSCDLWIKYLQAICELYFEYREMEKYRLSECLKKDIKSVIDILMQGAKKPYRDIINAVGWHRGGRTYFHVPPLERIYPKYENYLKRETKPALESILEDYNNEMPDFLKIDKGSIDKIIDHAFTSGNETLLISIIGINREYFTPSYFGEEGLWSYVRSLAVATESWVKEISEQNNFRGAIVNITRGDFDSCCSKLQERCNRTNLDVHSYSDLKQFLNAIQTTRFERNGKDLSWMKYIIRAYLIRNYVAHHSRLDSELFGSTLIELYKSLIFLVFYTWGLAKNHEHW